MKTKHIVMIYLSITIGLFILFYGIEQAYDPIAYQELSENIKNGTGYVEQGQFHTKYPPLYPFFAIPNISIKYTALYWLLISGVFFYLLLKKWNHRPRKAILLTGLLIFNPFYIYYSIIHAYAESFALAILLMAFAIDGKWTRMALFAALPVIKYHFVAFTIAYAVFTFRKDIWKAIMVFVPLVAWMAWNNMYKASISPAKDYWVEIFPTWQEPLIMAVIYVIVIICVFNVGGLFVIANTKKFMQNINAEQKMYLFGILIFLAMNLLFTYRETGILNLIMTRTRYVIPLIPFAYAMIKRADKELLGATIIWNICLAGIIGYALTYGFSF